MNTESILFIIFGAAAVITAIMMITRRNPVISAIFLILNFFTVAVIYLLLKAQFIAIIQVLVYMGAIMVLFLFVIMLLNLREDAKLTEEFTYKKITSVLISIMLFLLLGAAFYFNIGNRPVSENAEKMGTAVELGKLLFTEYSFHVLSIGMLLLAAVVGAVVLAKKNFE